MINTKAEYIWIDGGMPTAKLRSKTKIIDGEVTKLSDLPEWGFDGSSTQQAEGHFSDCLLRPVYFIPDPLRGANDILVMCEVFNADGSVHESNNRAKLRELAEEYKNEEHVRKCIQTGSDLFNRKVKKKKVDKNFFPKDLLKLMEENPNFYFSSKTTI